MHVWSPKENVRQVFWDGFLFFGSLTFALLLVNNTEVVNMTTLWHTTLIIAFFFFLFAVLTRLRIKMEPKNTRLDDLIIKFTTLETEIHQLKDTIDKNMETRDQKLIEAFRKALEENNVKLEEKLKEVFRTPKGRRS